MCLLSRKNDFLPENGGVLVHSRITLYVYAKIDQVNGGRPPTPAPWICQWLTPTVVAWIAIIRFSDSASVMLSVSISSHNKTKTAKL